MFCLQTIEHGSEVYQQMIELRRRVLRTPLGLDFSTEDLESERDDTFCCALSREGMVAGCLVLSKVDESTLRMRQVAVEPALQGNGIGRVLVRYSEEVSRTSAIDTIVLHARADVVEFYQRLGYEVVGDQFEEVSIPHFRMSMDISCDRTNR